MALVHTGCENGGEEHSAPATSPNITPVYNDSSAPSPDRNLNITIFVQSNTGFPVAGASVDLWYQSKQTTGFTDPDGVFVWPNQYLGDNSHASTLFYDVAATGFADVSGDVLVGDRDPYPPNIYINLVRFISVY